ncbi:MAG: peptide chain release factor N(5)-glutamine methyltransferase [Actinomycetota bacterium]|nr:peptide chain release factor N(5)-glutamine methyltransferase [Actinomycetota bacterium]
MMREPDHEVTRLLGWAAAFLEEREIIKPRLNAELLLSHCTGRSRVHLYAYPEKGLSSEEIQGFEHAVRRRASREPLQYIVGGKAFRYIDLAVNPHVLIPRPETESLVDLALERLRDQPGHPVVADIGTGSGCIALSLAGEYPAAVVHASDISLEALTVATHNGERLGLDGTVIFHYGDLLDALPSALKGACDVILSNPPYVKEEDFYKLPAEVREHEPNLSLVAGPEGTEIHRRLMEQAVGWLAPRGWLILEGGEEQMDTLARWARELGYTGIRVRPDLNSRPRFIEMTIGGR